MSEQKRDVVASPYFERRLAQLEKRYPHVADDLLPLADELEAGGTPGDQLPGVGYVVFKERLKNSDARKGKSGGYRVIYFLESADRIVLLTVYTKSDQENISAAQISAFIEAYIASKVSDDDSS